MGIWGEEVPSAWVVALLKQTLLKTYFQASSFWQDVCPGMPVLLLQMLVALPEICGQEANRSM